MGEAVQSAGQTDLSWQIGLKLADIMKIHMARKTNPERLAYT